MCNSVEALFTGVLTMGWELFNTALVVGVVSTGGAFLGSILSSRATLRSSQNALAGVDRQIRLQHAAKIAEFGQAWINGLRDAMSEFQAAAIIYERDQNLHMNTVLRLGAKIRLMMNKNDSRYSQLSTLMDDMLTAPDVRSRYSVGAKFTSLCQDILKTEWDVMKQKLADASKA